MMNREEFMMRLHYLFSVARKIPSGLFQDHIEALIDAYVADQPVMFQQSERDQVTAIVEAERRARQV